MMKSDDDYHKLIVFLTAMVFVIIAGAAYAYLSFQECTRVHPVWYCL